MRIPMSQGLFINHTDVYISKRKHVSRNFGPCTKFFPLHIENAFNIIMTEKILGKNL